MADYSMANRKLAYTFGRGWAYISDTSSTSGYMGAKYFQEFGPIFFDMSSTSGYMGAKYVQEFGWKYMPVLCQEYMLFFFCLPWSSQQRLNLLSTQKQGRAPPVWRPPASRRAPVVVC